ncbi:hypothetical protein EYR40_003531 [Pleurotus pulmonarius]|nr:hypothetical protein EYR36_007900 [Pleurotus pulmonarius]KAF4604750.1 hypothetical protein EYR40_003531 [Pleurotus pulmonarius]KAF4606250.1 hypothetical protein EYR38_000302 [Pleurotus pulmonarius]
MSENALYSSAPHRSNGLQFKEYMAPAPPNIQEVPDFDDPNIDPDSAFLGELEEDSPYPEVRSAVSNVDDTSIPVSTFRAWLIGSEGMIWAIIIPGLNQFFYFRYPSVTIGGIVAQLLSFPVGRAWATIMPNVRICGVSINPGPFTIKEHVLITIMASVGASSAYATDIVAVQRVYYKQVYNFSYQWMLTMSTQLIGFSIGGVGRRFLVQPPSMIWPSNLVTCTLFNTLHSQVYAGVGSRGGLSRERFFFYCFIASACWYIVPGYLFQALSVFTWARLIGNSDEFCAKTIIYVGLLDSAKQCRWAEANVAAGFVVFFWILTPVLYYKNVWEAHYLPISSRGSYDNTGKTYNVTRIINEDASLNVTEYIQYSPIFLSTTFAVSYGLSFASITATITHALLYYRKQIWTQARKSMSEQADIHARLMSRYAQVPDWWYLVIFLVMFAFGVICIKVWEVDLPVWGLVLALAVAFFYIIPIGMIQAITNQQVGLNVIAELIVGYLLPGKPIAMMMFKTYGYITMSQALTFTSDFKLGHYMKIPPRSMFFAQVLCAMIAGTVQLGVQAWMFTNIPGICTPDQKNNFICPNTEVFGTASIVWGVIGPARQFSKGQTY